MTTEAGAADRLDFAVFLSPVKNDRLRSGGSILS